MALQGFDPSLYYNLTDVIDELDITDPGVAAAMASETTNDQVAILHAKLIRGWAILNWFKRRSQRDV